MAHWTTALRPTASARLQFALAASAWTAVGAMLLWIGLNWLLGQDRLYITIALTTAAVLGTLKAATAMRKAARKAVTRISTREGKCAGGFFSWKMWLVALGMMAMGQLLRYTDIPRHYLAVVYVAVGLALMLGSVFIWKAYFAHQRA